MGDTAESGRRRGALWHPNSWPEALQVSATVQAAAGALMLAGPLPWPWGVSAIAASHLVIGAAGLLPRSALLGANLRRLDAAAPAVALTFDDGPDPAVTPRILDMLDRAGARATFGVVGEAARRHPALAAAILRRGHGVGNHTMRHPALFAAWGPAAIRAEIAAAQAVLHEVLGWRPLLFRAPMGFRNAFLAPVLASEGLRLVSWTRRALDGWFSDPARGAARLLEGLGPGDILLMHDRRRRVARGAVGRESAPLLLGRVLEALAGAGLGTVVLPGGRPEAACGPGEHQPDMHPGKQRVVTPVAELRNALL
jgi:peptidoglycan/xylan/chitin deacetylase (PgdA/CDA1 family)